MTSEMESYWQSAQAARYTRSYRLACEMDHEYSAALARHYGERNAADARYDYSRNQATPELQAAHTNLRIAQNALTRELAALRQTPEHRAAFGY